ITKVRVLSAGFASLLPTGAKRAGEAATTPAAKPVTMGVEFRTSLAGHPSLHGDLPRHLETAPASDDCSGALLATFGILTFFAPPGADIRI
ncbi:MAG TPA: hypothetical protein VNR51_09385, partial [Hyphomicrobium sp.]|nr:hypothetical protein [Hyphomicrobium sp.]